ncbi:hypothetical protein JZU46_00200 [bacterium]|nr:hypothetical protein [bacterium]
MVNETFIKDLNKVFNKNTISTELSPGSPRRYEPEQGVRKHNERIHSESRHADHYKNLPFTFSNVAKPKSSTVKFCANCGVATYVHKNAVGIICSACNKYSKLLEEPIND